MLSALRIDDAKREEGFTLIELLVVVIIIGILAAIAIPVFLNQRENAWESAVESDLRNAAIQMEAYFTDNGTGYLPIGADPETELPGFSTSEPVTMTVEASSADGYCLQATHLNLLDTSAAAITYKYDTRQPDGEQRPVVGTCA